MVKIEVLVLVVVGIVLLLVGVGNLEEPLIELEVLQVEEVIQLELVGNK